MRPCYLGNNNCQCQGWAHLVTWKLGQAEKGPCGLWSASAVTITTSPPEDDRCRGTKVVTGQQEGERSVRKESKRIEVEGDPTDVKYPTGGGYHLFLIKILYVV